MLYGIGSARSLKRHVLEPTYTTARLIGDGKRLADLHPQVHSCCQAVFSTRGAGGPEVRPLGPLTLDSEPLAQQ